MRDKFSIPYGSQGYYDTSGINAAKHTVSLTEAGLTDIICFHCQQCAEKYLQALLVHIWRIYQGHNPTHISHG
jgi:HEPN domain-containing protein